MKNERSGRGWQLNRRYSQCSKRILSEAPRASHGSTQHRRRVGSMGRADQLLANAICNRFMAEMAQGRASARKENQSETMSQ